MTIPEDKDEAKEQDIGYAAAMTHKALLDVRKVFLNDPYRCTQFHNASQERAENRLHPICLANPPSFHDER
ncbi:hypothetical protein L596_029284 [Steinernema carpocapsae]|uniref:Uncharacterized protein n=1 Tax=Steinernema carpocapsae TaxID=34508 RepID=A0A4U5LU71_STECR|nr:hypothetical protein L596_029284 [Steinernema carpocapsae]